MALTPFDHLVFDLDDTLLDTHGQLLPRAARESCEAMIAFGLKTNLELCLQAWNEHSRQQPRADLFRSLATQFGSATGDITQVAERGHQAFYGRKVESDISLFPGAFEMLTQLKKRYALHLVTAGTRRTQEEKISILKIAPLFTTISHVDPLQGQRKRDAFARLLEQKTGEANRYLSIGNRVDTDIAEAKEVGFQTCWVRYGEHAHMTPERPLEKPDFEVGNITELQAVCRL